MTEKLVKIEVDALTDTFVETELTAEELADLEKLRLSIVADQEAKQATRQSALSKLAALGLTEEEIAAL
jgi:hypothetical protein